MKQKILMTLALLITAVGGAWAQGPWTSGDCTVTLSNGTLTFSGKGAMDDYQTTTDRPWDGNKGDITSVVVESGVTTVGAMSFFNFGKLTSVTLPEGLTSIGTRSFLSCGKLTSVTIPSTVTSIGAEAFYSCTSVTDVNLYADPANLTWNEDGCDDFNRNPKGSTKCHVLAEHLSAYQTKFNGQVNVTFVGDLKPLATSDVEVTTNKAENDTVFTEAWFNMPAFDATAEYELVRDMTYQVNAYVGTDPEAVYRHRVEKVDATTYWPVDITEDAQIIALFPVIDIIDAQNPKTLTYGTDYTLAIVDEQENEIDPADFDFAPGTYTVKVTGKGDYDGQIESLNKFELYFGYELTVGPGEFATFYKDEALTLDENETEAQLYTITAVGTETATATELTIAKANMPILVKNTSEEAKTILLIPTVDDADEVTVAPEFVGTLEATTIAASTDEQNNYAFNGKQFVWVKDAIPVAANKCWLRISNGEPTARGITLVFSDATGVNGVIEGKEVNDGSWYDLNGRKLDKMPTKKGIYILNGKKVVVK